MITTTVMAVRATPKAIQLLDEEKRRQQADKLEPMDVVKTAWKCYIPAAVTGTVSVACLIGASSVNARRNAALTAAYTISESTLRDYQKKFEEKYSFPFALIADEDKSVINAFGVWGPKKFMGREFDGIHRTTFVIDENGIIIDVIEKVKTKEHASQIL